MTEKEMKVVLQPADLEAIERVIYRNGDDIAVSIGRSFERLEEKIIDAETRASSPSRSSGPSGGLIRCDGRS